MRHYVWRLADHDRVQLSLPRQSEPGRGSRRSIWGCRRPFHWEAAMIGPRCCFIPVGTPALVFVSDPPAPETRQGPGTGAFSESQMRISTFSTPGAAPRGYEGCNQKALLGAGANAPCLQRTNRGSALFRITNTRHSEPTIEASLHINPCGRF